MTRSRSLPIAALLAATTLSCMGDPSSPAVAAPADEALHGGGGGGGGSAGPTLVPQSSGVTTRLQAVSPVSEKVVWVSGVEGTFGLTTDGGETWHTGVVAGAELLQFRDVEGVSADVAYLLSAGVGTDSRVYKTEDGGATWTLQFQNEDPNGFYDCFAFWSPRRGITMADSVAGRFPVIRTLDGTTWQDIGDNLPAAQAGEAAFAASGTCAATVGKRHAWLATGGAEKARVLATKDGGETWADYETPLVQGTGTSGNITIAFRDKRHGVVGGGELVAPTEFLDTFARTRDGGQTWTLGAHTPFPGAIYGLAYVHGRRVHLSDCDDDGDRDDDGDDDHDDLVASSHGHRGDKGGWHHGQRSARTVVVTGPGGAAWTPDEGDTWVLLPDVANYWAVAFASKRAGWLVGTDGRILKISF
jgi:photosystem II stability/assembly factor-like uncharacterized protein